MDYHQLSKLAPLIAAIQDSNVTGVQAAIDNGADINFRIAFDENKTALHHAVAAGDPIIVDLLLQKGADPNAKSKDGKMPIELIVDNARKSTIEAVFKKHGCGVKPLPSPNSASSVPVSTYSKRKGTTSIRGQLYETKLLALVLFRALHRDDITSFNLATNVDDAGAFDDIVMRYTVNGTDKCIYLQAKHKDCKETNFKDMIDGSSEKGDFSLLKYFKSYLDLKIPKLQCDTISAGDEFVIFTNIGIKWTIPEDTDLKFHDRAVDTNHLFCTRRKGKSIHLSGSLKILKEATLKWYYESLTVILANALMFSKEATGLKEFITMFLQSMDCNKTSLELLLSCNSKLKYDISKIDRAKFDKTKSEISELLHTKSFPRAVLSDEDCYSLVTEFFDELCFYTNQANENEVEEILKSEILSLYPQSDDINLLFHMYHNAVQKWWLQTGQVPYQTKDSVLFANARSDIQRNFWLKNLHEISMNKMKMFNVEFDLNKIDKEFKEKIDNFMANKCDVLHVISNNQEFSCLKLYQYLTSKSFDFFYIDSDIINMNEFCSKVTTDVDCLILTCKRQRDNRIVQMLQQHMHKILIVTKTLPRGNIKFMKDVHKGLIDLTPKSQEEFLNRKVFFQGTPVILRSLLDGNLNLVDEQTLYDLMMEEVLEVVPGSKSTFHDEEMNYFVERTLSPCLLRDKILLQESFTVVFTEENDEFPDDNKDIIVVAASDELSDSIPLCLFTVKSAKFETFKFNDAQNFFDQICRKYPKRNIHLLQYVPSNSSNVFLLFTNTQMALLQWERSHNSIESLSEYAYRGGVEIEGKSLTDGDRSLDILAAEPGMGKSTYLTSLALKTKQKNPTLWIIRINLLDFSKTFDEWKKNGVKIDKEKAFYFLEGTLFKNPSGLENAKFSFGKHIFSDYCKLKKPILLVDGFDEICPNYKETVLTLLNIFKDNFISKMWITTRCGPIQMQLELYFTTFSHTLQPFKKADCIEFLSKFWGNRVKLLNERKLTTFIRDFYHQLVVEGYHLIDLIRVPLHTKIIASIYESDLKTFLNDSKQSSEFSIEQFDLLMLYEKMVEMAFFILHTEKNNADITKPSVRNMFESFFASCTRRNQILAAHYFFHENDSRWILSDRDRTSVNSFLEEVEDCQDKTGVIIGVIDKVPLFVHQTYAEYFCACLIFEKYASLDYKTNAFKKLVNTFLLKNIFRYESSLIIQFLNLIIKRRKNEILSRYAKAKFVLQHLLNYAEAVDNNQVFILFGNLIEQSLVGNNSNPHIESTIFQSTYMHKALLFTVACENGYLILARILINSVNLTKNDFLYLRAAASHGHAKIVSLLLEQNVTDDAIAPYIRKFMMNGKQFSTQYIDKNDPNFDYTALHLAAQAGHIEVVEILLANNAKVNTPSVGGHTPLLEAVIFSRFNVVKFLLENGADTNVCSYDVGMSPLHVATLNGHFEIATLLIEYGAQVDATRTDNAQTSLIETAREGHRDVVELLLDNGALVNSATSDHGLTALYMAAQNQHTEVVRLLLARGAIVDAALKSDGRTPLLQAASTGNMDLVEILLKHGANCNAATSNKRLTPLHAAARYGHGEVALLLLKNGAHVNAASSDLGLTPLHEAAVHGHSTVVKILVDYGADVNVCNFKNFTSLHMASQKGHLDIVRLLLENNACSDVMIDDDTFSTPLFLAAVNKHMDVVKLLIENDANVCFNASIALKLIDLISQQSNPVSDEHQSEDYLI